MVPVHFPETLPFVCGGQEEKVGKFDTANSDPLSGSKTIELSHEFFLNHSAGKLLNPVEGNFVTNKDWNSEWGDESWEEYDRQPERLEWSEEVNDQHLKIPLLQNRVTSSITPENELAEEPNVIRRRNPWRGNGWIVHSNGERSDAQSNLDQSSSACVGISDICSKAQKSPDDENHKGQEILQSIGTVAEGQKQLLTHKEKEVTDSEKNADRPAVYPAEHTRCKSDRVEELIYQVFSNMDELSGIAGDPLKASPEFISKSRERSLPYHVLNFEDELSLPNSSRLGGSFLRFGEINEITRPDRCAAVVALAQAAARVNEYPRLGTSRMQLSSQVQVETEGCEKCSLRFLSASNYRRHMRMHRKGDKVNETIILLKDELMSYLRKLQSKDLFELLSLQEFEIEGLTGTAALTSLAKLLDVRCTLEMQKQLNHSSYRQMLQAGETLLRLSQGKSSECRAPVDDLMEALETASEKTFLAGGTSLAVQRFIYQGQPGKVSKEDRNIVASIAFLMEHRIVQAFMGDKDAEACKRQQALVDEEEAAQLRRIRVQEKKRLRKQRLKGMKEKYKILEPASLSMTLASDVVEDFVMDQSKRTGRNRLAGVETREAFLTTDEVVLMSGGHAVDEPMETNMIINKSTHDAAQFGPEQVTSPKWPVHIVEPAITVTPCSGAELLQFPSLAAGSSSDVDKITNRILAEEASAVFSPPAVHRGNEESFLPEHSMYLREKAVGKQLYQGLLGTASAQSPSGKTSKNRKVSRPAYDGMAGASSLNCAQQPLTTATNWKEVKKDTARHVLARSATPGLRGNQEVSQFRSQDVIIHCLQESGDRVEINSGNGHAAERGPSKGFPQGAGTDRECPEELVSSPLMLMVGSVRIPLFVGAPTDAAVSGAYLQPLGQATPATSAVAGTMSLHPGGIQSASEMGTDECFDSGKEPNMISSSSTFLAERWRTAIVDLLAVTYRSDPEDESPQQIQECQEDFLGLFMRKHREWCNTKQGHKVCHDLLCCQKQRCRYWASSNDARGPSENCEKLDKIF